MFVLYLRYWQTSIQKGLDVLCLTEVFPTFAVSLFFSNYDNFVYFVLTDLDSSVASAHAVVFSPWTTSPWLLHSTPPLNYLCHHHRYYGNNA